MVQWLGPPRRAVSKPRNVLEWSVSEGISSGEIVPDRVVKSGTAPGQAEEAKCHPQTKAENGKKTVQKTEKKRSQKTEQQRSVPRVENGSNTER